MDLSLFVQRLEEARKVQGMTVKVLAEACNVSESTMTRYTKATVLPTLDIACKMAEVLGVSLDWLSGNATRQERMRIRTAGDLVRVLFELLTTESVEVVEYEKELLGLKEAISKHIVPVAEFDSQSGSIVIGKYRIPWQAQSAFSQLERLVSLYQDGDDFMKELVIAGIMKHAQQADAVTLPVKIDG